MVDLSVSLCGAKLKNPIVAASGEATLTLEGMKRAVDAGAGAVVAKSTNESRRAAEQLSSSRYVVLDSAWRPDPTAAASRSFSLYNRSGLVQMPFEEWLELLRRADEYARARDCLLVGSVLVADPTEAGRRVQAMASLGLRMVEVNLGTPHGQEINDPTALRSERDAQAVEQTVREVAGKVSIPVLVKLTAQASDVVDLAKAAVAGGAAGVALTTRYLGFLPDIETGRPLLGTFGGIGGPWALPLALRWVAKVHQSMPDLPIAGSNGALDGEDAVRFLMSGATAVQYCTAVLVRGYAALTEAVAGLEAYCQRKGVAAARELTGLAVRNAAGYAEQPSGGPFDPVSHFPALLG